MIFIVILIFFCIFAKANKINIYTMNPFLVFPKTEEDAKYLLNLAEEIGAKAFVIPEDIWKKIEPMVRLER